MASNDFQLLVEAQTRQRLLNTEGGEASGRILVPAVLHDLRHAVQNVGRLPAVGNIRSLVVDANDLNFKF